MAARAGGGGKRRLAPAQPVRRAARRGRAAGAVRPVQRGGGQQAAGAAGSGRQAAAAGRRGGGGGGGRGQTLGPLPAPVRNSSGGSTLYGNRGRTGVNNNAEAQPDEKLRALNAGPVDSAGRFQYVYCTKVGTTRPNEMYIIGAHMDGIGWGEAANDDGSGTALVMEMARIFSSPDVTTDVSIRFALWNSEEGGLSGARAYVAQREELQGIEDPPGSGRYPEPKWLGMIQHDMMMFDHGMPRADGTLSPEQRPEADFNIEWQSNSKMADGVDEARARRQARRRQVHDRLSRHARPAHDQHRLRPVHGHRRRRSACARTSAACTPAPAGTRTGTSRPTCSRRSPTRTSSSA